MAPCTKHEWQAVHGNLFGPMAPSLSAFVETGFPFEVDCSQGHERARSSAPRKDWVADRFDYWGGGKTQCVPTSDPQSKACLFGTDSVTYGFEEVESTSFIRWARSPLNCNRNGTGLSCLAHADVVVARSACATCLRDVGAANTCYQMEDRNCTIRYCEDEPLKRYWSRLRHHVDHELLSRVQTQRTGPPPLVLVHAYASWGDFFNTAIVRTLATQPAAFVARVVIATIEQPLPFGRWPQFGLFFSERLMAPPNFVTVPYSIHTASIIRPARERSRRPFALLFQGRSHGSFDGTRLKFLEQMMEAGGVCDRSDWKADTGENVVCVLPRNASERGRCSALLKASKRHCKDVPWGTCAMGSLALAAQATFCIEPTSDDLMRSHFYMAMQSGCIPVLFDGAGDPNDDGLNGGMTGMVKQPTRWAWRQPELLTLLQQSARHDAAARSLVRRVNYSAFALPYYAADLMTGRLNGLAKRLFAIATTDDDRLQSLRSAMDQAAPLMRWAPPTEPACNEEPCDAFSALATTVNAIRHHQVGRLVR